LAAALVRMAKNPARAGELGAEGRALVEERFTVQAMAANYQELYDRLLSRTIKTGK
jgi:glycosyltransferase involved in cell wall biosynthesis